MAQNATAKTNVAGIILLDIATSGPEAGDDQITEVAALKYTSDGKKDVFHHQFTGDDTEPTDQVFGDLLKFIGNMPLCGQNAVQLGFPLLAREMRDAGISLDQLPSGPVADIKILTWVNHLGNNSQTLLSLAQSLDGDMEQIESATGDDILLEEAQADLEDKLIRLTHQAKSNGMRQGLRSFFRLPDDYSEKFPKLQKALSERGEVGIVYQKEGHPAEERVINPKVITGHVVHGFCQRRQGPRKFSLAKIQKEY
ncbi:MAG: hypothetical protein RIQ81_2655 [Pseudomonadota bacterium]|jgi:hypothetical protein